MALAKVQTGFALWILCAFLNGYARAFEGDKHGIQNAEVYTANQWLLPKNHFRWNLPDDVPRCRLRTILQ